jgi:hypothetical protein
VDEAMSRVERLAVLALLCAAMVLGAALHAARGWEAVNYTVLGVALNALWTLRSKDTAR